jgi:hypothetical protein
VASPVDSREHHNHQCGSYWVRTAQRLQAAEYGRKREYRQPVNDSCMQDVAFARQV